MKTNQPNAMSTEMVGSVLFRNGDIKPVLFYRVLGLGVTEVHTPDGCYYDICKFTFDGDTPHAVTEYIQVHFRGFNLRGAPMFECIKEENITSIVLKKEENIHAD